MTIHQATNLTVGIVVNCSRRGLDIEHYFPVEITYYTHGTLLRRTADESTYTHYHLKIAIRHHHQKFLQETTCPGSVPQVVWLSCQDKPAQ